jgi:uncharacterized protein YqgC (DUF456 family)
MALLAWLSALVLMLAGVVGIFIPLLPDTVLIFAGAVLYFLLTGPGHGVGIPTLAGLGLLTGLTMVIDFVSGSVGAKWFGASRWGALGGIVGAVVGIFFGLVGIFVGPLVGVMLGELLGGKGILPAGRSTWGTLVGTTAGMLAKFGIAVVMVIWFLAAAIF